MVSSCLPRKIDLHQFYKKNISAVSLYLLIYNISNLIITPSAKR
nr:MAG TPA: hypothetical protein [Caudoviricetes sp.]